MATLTVLIPAWNDAGELDGALECLAQAAKQFGRIEVVIAAGGPGGQYDQAKQLPARFVAGSCTVIPQQPLGKMRALHDAMEVVASRPADYLLLLDADTRVDGAGLSEAISFLRGRSDLAGVGGVLRNGGDGVGSAHDAVGLACYTQREKVHSVTGWAILVRGDVLWAHWQAIFAPHDYPLHIDYQICERIVSVTGQSFAICPSFTLDTPRARGLAFLRAERRHHRAMFARGSTGANRRYIAGAAVTVALPIGALAFPAALFPPLWPVTLPLALLSARRLRELKGRYDLARSVDRTAERTSFRAFVRDEWVFSLSALLGAWDCVRGRADGPSFHGYRRPV